METFNTEFVHAVRGSNDGWLAAFGNEFDAHHHMCERYEHDGWYLATFGFMDGQALEGATRAGVIHLVTLGRKPTRAFIDRERAGRYAVSLDGDFYGVVHENVPFYPDGSMPHSSSVFRAGGEANRAGNRFRVREPVVIEWTVWDYEPAAKGRFVEQHRSFSRTTGGVVYAYDRDRDGAVQALHDHMATITPRAAAS